MPTLWLWQLSCLLLLPSVQGKTNLFTNRLTVGFDDFYDEGENEPYFKENQPWPNHNEPAKSFKIMKEAPVSSHLYSITPRNKPIDQRSHHTPMPRTTTQSSVFDFSNSMLSRHEKSKEDGLGTQMTFEEAEKKRKEMLRRRQAELRRHLEERQSQRVRELSSEESRESVRRAEKKENFVEMKAEQDRILEQQRNMYKVEMEIKGVARERGGRVREEEQEEQTRRGRDETQRERERERKIREKYAEKEIRRREQTARAVAELERRRSETMRESEMQRSKKGGRHAEERMAMMELDKELLQRSRETKGITEERLEEETRRRQTEQKEILMELKRVEAEKERMRKEREMLIAKRAQLQETLRLKQEERRLMEEEREREIARAAERRREKEKQRAERRRKRMERIKKRREEQRRMKMIEEQSYREREEKKREEEEQRRRQAETPARDAVEEFQAKRMWHAQRYREKLLAERERLEEELREIEGKDAENEKSIEIEVKPAPRRHKKKKRPSRIQPLPVAVASNGNRQMQRERMSRTTVPNVITVGKDVVTVLPKIPHRQLPRVAAKPLPTSMGGGTAKRQPLQPLPVLPQPVQDRDSSADEKYLRAYYKQYYSEWYRTHNQAQPVSQLQVTTPQYPAALTPLPYPGGLSPPMIGQSSPASTGATSFRGSFYGIQDPREQGSQDISKNQLDKMCVDIRRTTRMFGIKDAGNFAKKNCALIKMYYKQVTCEQIVHVMEYCDSTSR